MNDIRKDFIDLVKKYGEDATFETFNICSDYNCELAGSTIDKIVVIGGVNNPNANVLFYYNENTGDLDSLKAFKETDLKNFYAQLLSVLKSKEDEEEVTDIYSREYWEKKQVKELMEDYGFNQDLALCVFNRNWDNHHAFLSDVENCLEDEADYANAIRTIVLNEDING